MAAPDPLLKEWKQLGFSQVFTNWLRALSGTQTTVVNNTTNITQIQADLTEVEGDIDDLEDAVDGLLLPPPLMVEPLATTEAPGVIEIATQAEVDAGTDTERAVTPSTLAAYAGLDTLASWVPLTDGAEPPLLISDGAGNLVFVAWTP